MADMQADIDELESLLGICKSERNAKFLSLQIASLETQLKKIQNVAPATVPSEAQIPPSSEHEKDAALVEPTSNHQQVAAPPTLIGAQYTTIPSFGWDQGDYNSDTVCVYISSGIDGVEKVKREDISCDFTEGSFDLKIHGLNGKNYRLLKDNLDKEIVPGKSKIIVKKNRITIKLRKAKGQYGFDHWSDLTAKRKKTAASKADPTAGIMDMMKDMYDSGDDTMKKAIGEAMLKSREQQARGKSGLDDME